MPTLIECDRPSFEPLFSKIVIDKSDICSLRPGELGGITTITSDFAACKQVNTRSRIKEIPLISSKSLSLPNIREDAPPARRIIEIFLVTI